ncbi:Bacteriophage CI repressor helix-turn-helix domain-containing protein [Desulfocicer vacuolatum DSM 3385]|uniref:Bacteriophage CI repressor helix-turn-helix domain-containing protein n=1 Tax=Desulfocicer vacuolatum DSM 3385 TaxID=1121400 RepID=A0A1W2B9G3_9BACT|nr:helix-turn-helix domain-containing protein [Desulfocicer vacuolatum]SMC69484.1 Bacteriophage CI repressor helix-turn-helix domain-containing protein [Desulfocicer vacuolatum DSM 3385]
MSRDNVLHVHNILMRVKLILNLKTDAELAKILEIKPTTISAWKRRGNIDLNKIITLCNPMNVSMDWLLYGKGEECIPAANDPTEKIIKMLESMTDEQRRDVLKYVEKEKLWEEVIKRQKLA